MIERLKNTGYHFLRKTEKYTKTDMVYLASGGFWLSVKVFAGAILAFGLSLAFANLLPQATFGEYKYIFSIFGLLALATLPGMGTSVVKAIAQGFDGTASAAFKTKIRWGMLGSLGALAVALYYFIQGNERLAEAFLISAIFLPFVDTLGIFTTILNGKKFFRLSAAYEITVQAISIAVIIATLFYTKNLLLILLSYFLAYTITRFIALRLAIHRHTTNKKVDGSAIGYGKHLSAMEVLGTIAETAESMLLWQFLGPAALAVYSFAKAIPLNMSTALKRIVPLSLPKFAQRDIASIKKTLLHRMLVMFAGLAVIVLVYIVAAPYIYKIFFPQYIEAIFYSQLYVLTLLLFPKKILGTILNAHGYIKALYINSIAIPIIKLILLVILVPTFGILGAIFSELTTQLFSLILLATLFVRAKY